MKKQNLIIVTALVILAACNNKDAKQPDGPVVIADTEQTMKDVIAKFPDSLLLKEKLIQYYRDSGDYDKAIATANEILKKDSLNPRLWDIKATLHFENGDTLNAIRSFEKAIQILPDPGYIMSLGSLYAQTKNSRALAVSDLLLKDKNTKAEKEALFIKGLYFNYAGDKTRAIGFFDKCLSLDYTFMFGYREKAIALYDLGKYEEAIKVLDKAVTLQNNFDEGYYWRGRCLEKLNKPNEAIEEYRTALMYSPDFVEAKEALSKLETK
ncbi:MAG: tetratricopeptide repeat protein [Ferruginibacter sp.]